MTCFVGLDVSQKMTVICVVDIERRCTAEEMLFELASPILCCLVAQDRLELEVLPFRQARRGVGPRLRIGVKVVMDKEQIASLRGDVAISIADHTRHDTVSAIARAVLATAPNRFALCGLSMGGYIAFEMMRQAPDRIERVALLDTSALSDTPEQTERRLKLIAMAQSGQFKSVRDTLWPLFVHPARRSV